MQVCPQCIFPNMEGALFCEDCGEELHIRHSMNAAAAMTNFGQREYALAGSKPKSLVLWIEHLGTSISIPITDEMVLGRYGDKLQTMLEIDLTAFGALEYGVSRRHAVIYHKDGVLSLVDLDSSNGTFLNGRQLPPHRAWILREHDEIWLGRFICQVKLQTVEHSSALK
jgi:hypothetical protein